jgi:hypothetical protein|tara:strand:+ start:9255 stop:9383 length:129 start_codon:yes stop_codon:yes gene_type:complete
MKAVVDAPVLELLVVAQELAIAVNTRKQAVVSFSRTLCIQTS